MSGNGEAQRSDRYCTWRGRGDLNSTEMQALIAATKTSADLCGVADSVGTVEVGKLADLIVVPANPLESISNLRMLKMVFKGGSLVHEGKRAG